MFSSQEGEACTTAHSSAVPSSSFSKPTPARSTATSKNAVNLREGLGLDSVDVVSIVSQIERRFHIRLTHQELEKLVTVADVLDLLQAKLADTSSSPSAAA